MVRLSVIGERAAQRLLDLAGNRGAMPEARVAAFRALDAIGEPRALDAAMAALGDDHLTVVAAAISVTRAFLHTPKGLEALDRLSDTATDRQRATGIRVAAIEALASFKPETVQPLLRALQHDPDPVVVSAARGTIDHEPRGHHDAAHALLDAAERALPGDPMTLRAHLAVAAGTIPATVLHTIVEKVRIREGAESGAPRAVWTAARASAHLALAQRGSRLALYDLRETIESARSPVAPEFLSALSTIGDTTCLEPVAAAYAAATVGAATAEDWWRRGLADAFRRIAEREAVTRRHAVVKRIEKRWPGLFDALTTLLGSH